MKLRQLFLLAIVATLLVSFKQSDSVQPDITVVTRGTLSDLLAEKELESATRLVIVGSLNDADFETLRRMPNLTHLNISQANITALTDRAFLRQQKLETITLPQHLKSIGEGAFYRCCALTSIVIPEGVTSIGEGAFADCRALTSIVIPSSVTSIGESAFYGCDAMTSISVSPKNTAYKDIDGVLHSKDGKTLIAYPASKTATSYVVESAVTSIGDGVFSRCSNLTSIVIPEAVTSIEYATFWGCDALTSVVIPEGVTSIGGAAFWGCRALTSIVIPEGVTSIKRNAFYGCNALTKITCLATTPPELSETIFYRTNKTTRVLEVPAKSVKAYKNDEIWRSSFKRIKAIKPNKTR